MAMKAMVVSYFKWLPAVLLVVATAACTTSTRLIQSEISVDKSALLTGAASSTGQVDKIKNETSTAINPNDYKRTISRLTPLAEEGQADAQYSLGYMYYNGMGVSQNDSMAIKLLASAAKQGHTNAIEALRRIALSDNRGSQHTVQAFSAMPQLKTTKLRVSKTQIVMPNLPEVANDVMVRTITSESQSSLTKNERWIMSQPGKRYTIQLVATANKASMLRFIDRNNLRGSAVYYKTKRKNNDWFTLILGSFESLSTAKKTVSRLSPTLRKTKPWVKPISGIQKALAIR